MSKLTLQLIFLMVTLFASGKIYSADDEFESQVDDLLYKNEEAEPRRRERNKSYKFEEINQLKYLSPFKDVAIIQKKLLPKTSRWEAFPGVGVILNDAFFTNQIFSFRFGYHFSEKYSTEFVYAGLSQSEKDVTKDLDDYLSVTTSSIVVPQSYTGLDFKFTPFYGKMSYLDSSIVPYETYFSAGLGMMKTNQNTSPMSLHAGIGQHFALNKSLAIRWDTSFYWYNSANQSTSTESLYTNIHFTIGASFFFPGVDN